MTVNNQFSVSPTQINFSYEAKAFEFGEGGKIPASPVSMYRHIYTETINTQDANARLLIESDSKQAWLCDLILNTSNPSYRIDVLQPNANISAIQSNIGTGNKLIYSYTGTSLILQNMFLPPECKMFIVAYNSISQVFLSARRYYTQGIEKVV